MLFRHVNFNFNLFCRLCPNNPVLHGIWSGLLFIMFTFTSTLLRFSSLWTIIIFFFIINVATITRYHRECMRQNEKKSLEFYYWKKIKHHDGTILGFIDKVGRGYLLTMGENLNPTMKICLIGFVITMVSKNNLLWLSPTPAYQLPHLSIWLGIL